MDDEDDIPFVQSKPPAKQEKKRKRDSEEEEKEVKNEPDNKKVKELTKPPKVEVPEKKDSPNPPKKNIENSEKPLKKRISIKDEEEGKEDKEDGKEDKGDKEDKEEKEEKEKKPVKKKVPEKKAVKKVVKKKVEKDSESEEEDEDEEMSDEEEDSPKKSTPKKAPKKVTKKTPTKKTPPKKTPVKKKKKEESENESGSESESASDSEDPSESESESGDDEDGSEYSEEIQKKKKPAKKSPKKSTPKKPAKKTAPKKTPTKKTPTKKTSPKKTTKKKEEKEDEEDEEENESGSDESNDESEESPKKKPAKKSSKGTPKKSPTKKKKKEGEEESSQTSKKGKKKKEEEPIREWWNEKPLPKGQKWRTLSHNGVLFADPYEPHGIKLLYDGKPVELTEEEEEVATFYARYLDTDHVKKPIFRENFFEDFKAICNPDEDKKHWLKSFEKCDFTLIKNYLEEQKLLRKAKTKSEKEAEKKKKEELDEIYGFAMVDGFKEKVGNYKIEPPGLFLGRGKHPKTGKVKLRVMPEQVTINIGKKEKPPKCPIKGHNWGKIINNNTVTWLAHWKENVNGQCKYVWLAPSSKIKGEADMKKFDKARKLKKYIKKIREEYTKNMKDEDLSIRQRAVCLYFIDHLALRIGNEKDKSKSADTVGCCSLRVEHVRALDKNRIEFDFLGKDSMHYHNIVKVDKLVYKNVVSFLKDKNPEDKLFDVLNAGTVNRYLKSHMPGLTAKVFRTYNASVTLQKELEKTPCDEDTTPEEKILYYNRANRQVAILCNHKKSVPKKFGEQIEKIDYKIDVISEEIDRITEALQKQKKKKYVRTEEEQEAFETRRDRIVEFEEKEEKRHEERQKDKETKKEFKRSDPEKELPDDVEKLKNRLTKLEESLKKNEINKQQREENSEVALGTSKINYNDPRITVAWTKKHEIPIEKVFSANLRKKFPWAQMADSEFKF